MLPEGAALDRGVPSDPATVSRRVGVHAIALGTWFARRLHLWPMHREVANAIQEPVADDAAVA